VCGLRRGEQHQPLQPDRADPPPLPPLDEAVEDGKGSVEQQKDCDERQERQQGEACTDDDGAEIGRTMAAAYRSADPFGVQVCQLLTPEPRFGRVPLGHRHDHERVEPDVHGAEGVAHHDLVGGEQRVLGDQPDAPLHGTRTFLGAEGP
jgi:hypothetical protein